MSDDGRGFAVDDDMDPFRTEAAVQRDEAAAAPSLEAEDEPPPPPPSKSAAADLERAASDAGSVGSAGGSPRQVMRLRDDTSKGNAIQGRLAIAWSLMRSRSEQIIDAIKTTDGATAAYIAYVIRSEQGDARRRYSEFEALRGVLAKLYPVLIIPPIPPHHALADYAVKQSKAKEDANVIARRRRMLAVFLNRCNRHPLLGQDRVLRRFLDPAQTWSEITHSAPVTLLPKNILKAPSHDPTDTTLAQLYSSLPSASAGQPLQDPDRRFLDSEDFTSKFSNHLQGSMEKVNRRLMKRWAELGADHAELGGLLNGFGLTESASPALAAAIERSGAAVDNTYVHTNAMLQDWERRFTEPLAEYSQFSAIIRSLLKYRHNKHLQFEMARDVLESKLASLQDLERSEAEARRLDQALDRARQRAPDAGSVAEMPSPSPSEPVQSTYAEPASAPLGRSRSSPAAGFLGALQHTIHGLIDGDPERSRRDSIGKTRDSIGQLQEASRLTTHDLRYASTTIQADLDRFQKQKVGDLREMCLGFARFHTDWAEKNLEQWSAAKDEIARLAAEA